MRRESILLLVNVLPTIIHMATGKNGGAGKKVFFLYPHSVIQEQMLQIIFMAEFEVYLLKDHRKAIRVMREYPDSILYINIDEVLKEQEWLDFVKNLMESEETKSVQVGILSYNENSELARTYLMDLGVSCGFIRLKLGIKESAKIILRALDANEAKGKRKHVRATCSSDMRVGFNVKIDADLYKGRIVDISIAGLAVVFNDPVSFKQGTKFNDIQLNLRGTFVKVSGVLAGTRNTPDGMLYVIVFTGGIDGQTKLKMHQFIYWALQNGMDKKVGIL